VLWTQHFAKAEEAEAEEALSTFDAAYSGLLPLGNISEPVRCGDGVTERESSGSI